MAQSFTQRFEAATFDSGVGIFGVIRADSGLKGCLEVAERHIDHGADFLDVRGSSLATAAPSELNAVVEELTRCFPGRIGMLDGGVDVVSMPLRAQLSFYRQPSSHRGVEFEIVDSQTAQVVAKSCAEHPRSFLHALSEVRSLVGSGVRLPLHLDLSAITEEGGSGICREGIIATQVAVAIIEGVEMLSVEEVLSAVKARDEIAKISRAS